MSEDAKIDQATQEAIAEHTDTVAHQPAQEATAECADAMVQQSVEQDSGEGRKTVQAEALSAQEPAADSGGEADAPEAGQREGGIDNFGDVAALASEAGAKAAETAKSAAGTVSQTAKSAADTVSQTAKSAYSRTTEVAKRAVRSAGTQAAVQAELNQERAVAAEGTQEAPKSAWEIISQAWVEYLSSHKATVLYGIVGLLVGLCILWFGFWPVLLVVATSYAGITYGRYRDGDAKVVSFLLEHFGEED